MILWFITLAVECLLLLGLTRSFSSMVWITLGFTLFAFISQLILWLYIWRKPLTANESFLHMPLFAISMLYMLLQAIPCLVFAFWQAPVQIAVFVHVVLTVVMWTLLISCALAKSHIEKMSSRQNNYHKEL